MTAAELAKSMWERQAKGGVQVGGETVAMLTVKQAKFLSDLISRECRGRVYHGEWCYDRASGFSYSLDIARNGAGVLRGKMYAEPCVK